MKKVGDILKLFDPLEDKYISREFQSYGIYLAEELGDYKHRSMYIRLAKNIPRAILEKALSFVKDANAKSKPRLFLWKMKQLRTQGSSDTGLKSQRASVRVIVKGQVQGVGFRAYVIRKAQELAITGMVKNLPDGSVEILGVGEKPTLIAFIKKCQKGPMSAKVISLCIDWQKDLPNLNDFEVLY